MIEVKVPVLSESVSDATLAQWHKKIGDYVKRDENLVDLETDKVMLEVVAPHDGMLAEIKQESGTVVGSGEVLALIDENAEKPHSDDKPAAEAGDEKQAPREEPEPAETEAKKETPEPEAPAAAMNFSPAVRKLITENKLDPSAITGTGRDGRITKADVLKHIEQRDQPAAAPAAPSTSEVGAGGRPERRVPMTRLRTRIAERLLEAQQTTAMLTTFNEINMKPVMDLRAKYQDKFIKKHDIKLGFMSFFIQACCEALKEFPVVNASIDGSDIVYHGFFDIGVAVSTERGLVVPIIRDADQMNLAEMEQAVADFAGKARQGKLSMEELSGGTFSITNGGIFGSLLSTPILNPPQSAILGMHKIEQRPVVEDGEIVIRPMMYVAMSYDHRIVDGKEAVSFLVKVKDVLEDPARMLLQV